MAVNGDYAHSVQVNGFTCHNCAEVDLARKHIDPAHPKSGPYDVNASTDPSRKTEAVLFGGALTGASAAGQGGAPPYAPGAQVNLSA